MSGNSQRFNVHKNENYTIMSNYHLRERGMSLKAKGLLSVILSLPSDWDYSIAGLVAISRENETAIKSALNELKRFGYLKVTKQMPNETESGRIEYAYDIYEQPSEKVAKENLAVEKQGIENLGVENQGQLNTNKTITKNKNTNNKENNDQPAKPSDQELVNEFEDLWRLYPRKQGKAKALEAYKRARKAGVDKTIVLDGITRYNAQIKANKTAQKYIMQGSTWFNGKRWEDEYTNQPTTRPKTKQEQIDDEWLQSLE